MSKHDVSNRLSKALVMADGLTQQDVAAIGVLITAGEWELALETLCTQLFEYDVEVSVAYRAKLEALGTELGVNAPHLLGDP
ncbi:MAG: MafI family immunity protein [Acidimicrobiia bacterium]